MSMLASWLEFAFAAPFVPTQRVGTSLGENARSWKQVSATNRARSHFLRASQSNPRNSLI
jgi:hypothetical protein